MSRKDLQIFFALEVFAVIWAGALFSLLESRLLAGALAGAYFVISGLYMTFRALKWASPWRSATLYILIVQTFGVSLPMLTVRMLHSSSEFSEVQILGFSGPQFHEISTGVFSALMIGTIVDWVRSKWAAKIQPTIR